MESRKGLIPIPSICKNGHLYPSRFFLGPGTKTSISGRSTIESFCPFCGSPGEALPGDYENVDEALEFIAASNVNKKTVDKLKEILESTYQQKKKTKEETIKEIITAVPELKKFAGVLRKIPVDRWLVIIGLLLQLLSMIDDKLSDDEELKINSEKVEINNYSNGVKSDSTKHTTIENEAACPCNSGKLFLECHGKDIDVAE